MQGTRELAHLIIAAKGWSGARAAHRTAPGTPPKPAKTAPVSLAWVAAFGGAGDYCGQGAHTINAPPRAPLQLMPLQATVRQLGRPSHSLQAQSDASLRRYARTATNQQQAVSQCHENALQSVERRWCIKYLIFELLQVAERPWGTGLGKADGVGYAAIPVSAGITEPLASMIRAASHCIAPLSARKAPSRVGETGTHMGTHFLT